MSFLSPEIKDFIASHFSDNTDKLLLNAQKFPGIDVPFAVDQILARRQIRDKLPSWYKQPDLLFPSRLSAEQCSSETTACYKQNLIRGERVCDLTGGLGIDSWYLSRKAKEVVYIERFPEYCRAAEHNFRILGANNIHIRQADVREILSSLKADTFYIDPARRSDNDKRIFALSDCEPDVIALKQSLLSGARRLIIKASPMVDLSESLRLLPETTEIHILALRNECKEILFVLEKSIRPDPMNPLKIFTRNFIPNGEDQEFSYIRQEESCLSTPTTCTVGHYLYEPNTAVLKSGAFKSIAHRYRLNKLHPSSHLYTSDVHVSDFPGRIFTTVSVYDFSQKHLKELGKKIPKANITVRNFPLSVETLRKRTGITEGGDIYLFATTLADARRILIDCRKFSL